MKNYKKYYLTSEGYNKTYMVWDEDDHTTKVYDKEIKVKKLPRTGM